jgi:flavin reductase (DIM6/NTAB) family NADH-FMN oxidoreductase RutF
MKLITFCFSFSIAICSYSQDCEKIFVKISKLNPKNEPMRHNKADTLQIQVACLDDCVVIVECETISITPLGNNNFLFTPNKVGKHLIKVFTDCPKEKVIKTKYGGTINVEGKQEIADLYEVVDN